MKRVLERVTSLPRTYLAVLCLLAVGVACAGGGTAFLASGSTGPSGSPTPQAAALAMVQANPTATASSSGVAPTRAPRESRLARTSEGAVEPPGQRLVAVPTVEPSDGRPRDPAPSPRRHTPPVVPARPHQRHPACHRRQRAGSSRRSKTARFESFRFVHGDPVTAFRLRAIQSNIGTREQ
jgi:hypothetical protein